MKLKTLLIAVMSLVAMATTAQTTAYAVYCAGSEAGNDPATLYFLAAETEPTGTYNGQTITGVWSGGDVTSNYGYPKWYNYNANITRVVFEESFKDVKPTTCYRWFNNCAKLATIEGIANLNTGSVTDMGYMFYGCSALTTLDLSSFTTAKVTTMGNMFNGCKALTTLDLSSFTTESVMTMGNMFNGCKALTTLDLSSFTTGEVMDMSYMFNGCSALTTLDLSRFTTAKVTNMNYMFKDCSALKALNLSNFNTEAVTDMSFMFYGCSVLELLTLGNNFSTGNVTNMINMFCGCSALTTLNLSSFNTAKVTDMSFMFKDCSALTSLYISTFTTDKLNKYDYMFTGCDALRMLYMNKADKAVEMVAANSGFAKRGMILYLPEKAEATGDVFEENYVVKAGGRNSTSFTRTFTGGKISTVCLPFEVNTADVTDGTFYEFKDCNDGKTVKFTKLADGTTKENKAYLFKPNNDAAGDVKVTFSSTLPVLFLPELTEGDANGLYGVYTKKEFTPEEADKNIYYGWSAGNFVSIGAGATLNPGRAYLKVAAPQGSNAKDILNAIFDDETTGISEVNTTADDNAPAYDLMGRRVGAGYKGIVIKNGRKIRNYEF